MATTSAVVALPAEGPNLFPGTYSTNFDPQLTLTIGHEVDLDCAPGYRCRGDINVNLPDWLDFEFGNDHGSELMIFGLDKLNDPQTSGKLLDPPADFATWVASHAGISLLEPAHSVVVGGIAGVELDIKTGDAGLSYGPADVPGFPELGIGPSTTARLDALRVGGRQVLIQRTLGPENIAGNFDAAVQGIQSVVDSIQWVRQTGAVSFNQTLLVDLPNQDSVGGYGWGTAAAR